MHTVAISVTAEVICGRSDDQISSGEVAGIEHMVSRFGSNAAKMNSTENCWITLLLCVRFPRCYIFLFAHKNFCYAGEVIPPFLNCKVF